MSAEDDRSLYRGLFKASMVGINLVATTVVGFIIGYYLDKWLGTGWLKFVFLFVGIVVGFRDIFRLAKPQAEKKEEDDKKNT